MKLNYSVRIFLLSLLCIPFSLFAIEKENSTPHPSLSYADATLMLTKYSGFFDRYVPEKATLRECVVFLNKQGVKIDVQKITENTPFLKKDCAQIMGQINLLLSGEAIYSADRQIVLPEGLDSWEEYCTINGVEFIEAYKTMTEMLRIASTIK